jgi:hypothetical protein
LSFRDYLLRPAENAWFRLPGSLLRESDFCLRQRATKYGG